MEDLKTFLRNNSEWKSTEVIHSLMEQPQNACPHADKVISVLETYEANLSVLKDKLVDIPTSLIEDKNIYLFYVNQIDHAIEIISNNVSQIATILEQVEEWRSRCLNARRMFTEDKKALWEIIRTRKKPENVHSIISELTWANENVDFELEAIEFEKYEPNCSFFHENFAWLDVEQTFVSLQVLKDIYLDLFKWGNEIISLTHTYQVEDKKYSLSLDDSYNNTSVDVNFNDVYEAMQYVFKNGLPSKVIINNTQESVAMAELFANFLLQFKNATENNTVENFEYEVISKSKNQIEELLSKI